MKSFLLSSLAAASTLAIGALAFAGDATFELWSSVVDKERSYALVNMETQETVAMSGSGKKLALNNRRCGGCDIGESQGADAGKCRDCRIN